MDTPSLEPAWSARARRLTQALIVSAALNVGLVATFAYFIMQEKEDVTGFELQPILQKSETVINHEGLLRSYSTSSFQDLLAVLEDKEHVEQGFTKRDFALACLVAFHHFNLEKALGGPKVSERHVLFTSQEGFEKIDLALFPGLTDYQYQAIAQYAKTEKWPLTAQGLFFEIQRSSNRDASLLEAFYLSAEFHAVSTLFAKTGLMLEKETIVTLIAEGNWKLLDDFTRQQRAAQDLTESRRRTLLLEFLQCHSKAAARIIIETDMEFALKRLDDAQVLLVLDTLSDKSPYLENFSKGLLASPRSDGIWKRAASTLYAARGETLPEPYDHAAALQRFVSSTITPAQSAPAPQAEIAAKPATPDVKVISKGKPKRLHLVQEGESLWKIARRYHITVEELKKFNHLDSDKIRPGRTLEIP